MAHLDKRMDPDRDTGRLEKGRAKDGISGNSAAAAPSKKGEAESGATSAPDVVPQDGKGTSKPVR